MKIQLAHSPLVGLNFERFKRKVTSVLEQAGNEVYQQPTNEKFEERQARLGKMEALLVLAHCGAPDGKLYDNIRETLDSEKPVVFAINSEVFPAYRKLILEWGVTAIPYDQSDDLLVKLAYQMGLVERRIRAK
jgi:hypothetical protein